MTYKAHLNPELISKSQVCLACGDKMLGVFDYDLRADCIDCQCESPEEILRRLNIIGPTENLSFLHLV